MATKKTCPATKIMHPLKWVSECQKLEGHKGQHERWSETKKWVYKWSDEKK